MDASSATAREISCRVTHALLRYVRETKGSLGGMLEGLELDEAYLSDTNNWISHTFLQTLYGRMIDLLGDDAAVYKMALASKRHESMGLLEWIARLLGNPKLVYAQSPWYNRLLKTNGDVSIRATGADWVLLEDRYHDGARKTRYDCDYTRGILAGIPTVFDLPPARVEEIECQVTADAPWERPWPERPPRGRTACLYRVQWEEKAREPLWRRLFQGYRLHRRAIDNLLEANRLIQEKYAEAQRLAIKLGAVNRQLTESQQQLEISMAQLQVSERRYRLLADHVTDTIWILDLQTLRFTYMSPAIERLSGYPVSEAMGLTLEGLLGDESLKEALTVLEAELARETTGDADPDRTTILELSLVRKDGTSRWIEIHASFLRDPQGLPAAVLGVTRDISERREAEAINRARLAAEAANAAKTEFLSHVSHELRTPLNHIMGFTELILAGHAGPLAPLQKEYLDDVYRSSQHLLDLVNEILDVARIEAGRIEIRPVPLSLRSFLENSLSIVADRAREKDVALRTRIESVPETILADEVRLRQILYNLLANAVKFTDRGGTVVLGARMLEGQDNGGDPPAEEIEIRVEDNGIGIPTEQLERIFEPFARLEGALSGKYPGTGLGLTLARNLATLHGGRLWGESRGPGQGSVFFLTLPWSGR